MMEFEGQNNDFGGTKRYNNIPLVPPNFFGPPPMGAVGPDFKDRVDTGHNHSRCFLLITKIVSLVLYYKVHITEQIFTLCTW